MKNKKQSKGTSKSASSQRKPILLSILIVLILGSGVGVTHTALSSPYKDPTKTEPNWCSVCHKKPTSHNEQWANMHGAFAQGNRDYCKTCHQEKFCKDCHMKKPAFHDSNWLVNHQARAQEMRQGCYECCCKQNRKRRGDCR